MKLSLHSILSILAAVITTISCDKKPDKTDERTDAKYGIVVFAGEDLDEEYLLPVNSLTQGELKISENSEKIYSLVMACRDGYYYGIDDGKPVFTKYKPTDKGLVAVAGIPFDKIPWKVYESWYSWVDDRTLLIGSTLAGKQFTYSIVDVVAMKLLSHGNLNIPLPPNGLKYGGVIGAFRDNRLFVGYTHYEGWQSKTPPVDTTFVAVIDYPSMKTICVQKDTRSTWPGGVYLHAPYSFQQEGDIYFLAAPGGRTHSHPSAPSGIYRIKKGEEKLDPDYFFQVTDNKKQETYLLYHLGNDKALVKMIDKDRITKYMDYVNGYLAKYYVLDLKTQTKTLLNLPLSALTFTENVLVENGKAYISISENERESHIWVYDVKSGTLKKGLKVQGRVLLINKLKED